MLPQTTPSPLTSLKEPIGHPNWIYELKHDGFRGILYVERDQAWLVSRKGKKFRQFDPLLKQVLRCLKDTVPFWMVTPPAAKDQKQADVPAPLSEKLGLGKWADEMLETAVLVANSLRSGESESALRMLYPKFFEQVVDALPTDYKETFIKLAKTRHVSKEVLLNYLGKIKHLAGSTLADNRKEFRKHVTPLRTPKSTPKSTPK